MASANKKISSSIVRLNVGGKHFDTTRETLHPAAFFTPWLEGRFEMACDEGGRVFIDRDWHLFEIILSFLRNSQRLAQTTIDVHKKALLAECEFFQIDSLAYHIRGDLSPYPVAPVARERTPLPRRRRSLTPLQRRVTLRSRSRKHRSYPDIRTERSRRSGR